MKRSILPFVLLLLFGIVSTSASFAEGGKSITILASGSVKGNIDPCLK